MDQELSLSVIVNPGTVTENFQQFKQLLQQELDEKYSTIEVSEERLKDAKEARARLNKARSSLKEAMMSAQIQNDEPLIVPRQQAQELDQLLGSYIVRLDTQIKEIEAAQREQRLRKASEIFIETVASYPADVQEIAVQCKWTVNDKWGNATYSTLQVRKDCKAYCDEIQTALQTFEGEFRPQMIADFIKNGSVSQALLFGTNLRRQKEAYEARWKAEDGVSAPEVKEPVPEKETAQEPVSHEQEATAPQRMIQVVSPTEFMDTTPQASRRAYIDLRITAVRFMIEWLLHVLKDKGMSYERLTAREENRA